MEIFFMHKISMCTNDIYTDMTKEFASFAPFFFCVFIRTIHWLLKNYSRIVVAVQLCE